MTANDGGFSSPCPTQRVVPSHPGVSIVAGVARGPLSVGCFTTKDIEDGRAAMFAPPVGPPSMSEGGFSSRGLSGAPAQAESGRLARRRTLVVGVTFPRVTFSAALSHVDYYVARGRRGWLVWGIGPG